MTEKGMTESEARVERILFKEPFVLDERSKIVVVGDTVLFVENGVVSTRKVWGVRMHDGKGEVKVLGSNGGWKREFFKLGDDTKYGIN